MASGVPGHDLQGKDKGTTPQCAEGVMRQSDFSQTTRVNAHVQYEALGSVQKKKADNPAVKPFRPTFSGRTSGFSPQPAYMASPAIKPSKSQVSIALS